MRRFHNPVIAKKCYCGVTVGYVVGWKARYCNLVRNIRAGLIFKTEKEARTFRDNMERMRVDQYPTFEILDKE